MNTTLQKRIDTRAVGIGLEFRDAIASRGSNRDVAEAVATLTQTAAHWMAEWLLEHLWISVDNALPEKSGEYFVSNGARFREADYDAELHYWVNEPFLGCKFGSEDVTHWMMIPEMPKGGEE